MTEQKSRTINFVVAVIIVAIILGLVAFLLSQEDKIPQGDLNVSTPQGVEEQETPEGWLQYQSDRYRFSLFYPEDWLVLEEVADKGESAIHFLPSGINYKSLETTNSALTITPHSSVTHVCGSVRSHFKSSTCSGIGAEAKSM